MKCPFCGYEGKFEIAKEWKFRFYLVRRAKCPKCGGIFNYYSGVTSGGKLSEFVIRVRPRKRDSN
ncbi:MAG: hypothetical protein RMI56_02960 [Sulfolobales archaeon]|nr:hypothetical protein [Sulfolobales archaeon]MDW8082740.1 hypothetical protein [Sulfolobales archaeon]